MVKRGLSGATTRHAWSALTLLLCALACGHVGLDFRGDEVVLGAGGERNQSGSGGDDSDTTAGGGDGNASGGTRVDAAGGKSTSGDGGEFSFGGGGYGGASATCSPECICSAAMAEEGCHFTCSEAPCDVRCEGSCEVESGLENQNVVNIDCAAGATCEVSPPWTNGYLQVNCQGPGTCLIECKNTGACRALCEGQGSCNVLCEDTHYCAVECKGSGDCWVSPAQERDVQCSGGESMECDDGSIVCGRSCGAP